MAKTRCIVLIDGSNFYFKLKDLKLHQLLKFDFSALLSTFAKKAGLFQLRITLAGSAPMAAEEVKSYSTTNSVF